MRVDGRPNANSTLRMAETILCTAVRRWMIELADRRNGRRRNATNHTVSFAYTKIVYK